MEILIFNPTTDQGPTIFLLSLEKVLSYFFFWEMNIYLFKETKITHDRFTIEIFTLVVEMIYTHGWVYIAI